MFRKLTCFMCVVAFVRCENKGQPPNNGGSGGHGPPQCSPRNCPHPCPSGYVVDENGCQTCACDLCSGITCPSCEECAAVPSDCGTAPCPLVPQCICQPPGCPPHTVCVLGYPISKRCLLCGVCNQIPNACNWIRRILT